MERLRPFNYLLIHWTNIYWAPATFTQGTVHKRHWLYKMAVFTMSRIVALRLGFLAVMVNGLLSVGKLIFLTWQQDRDEGRYPSYEVKVEVLEGPVLYSFLHCCLFVLFPHLLSKTGLNVRLCSLLWGIIRCTCHWGPRWLPEVSIP